MSGFVVQVDDSQVIEALGQMRERAMRMKPFMSAVGMIMLKSVHDNFAAQGRPSKWKPLAPSTLLSREIGALNSTFKTRRWQKAKKGATKAKYEKEAVNKALSNKILQQSGMLRQSVVLGSVTDQSVEIGSSLPYARIHQLGGEMKAVTIQARNAKALLVPVRTAAGVTAIYRKTVHIPARKMPARPYLVLQQSEYDVIAQMAEDYLTRGEIG